MPHSNQNELGLPMNASNCAIKTSHKCTFTASIFSPPLPWKLRLDESKWPHAGTAFGARF